MCRDEPTAQRLRVWRQSPSWVFHCLSTSRVPGVQFTGTPCPGMGKRGDCHDSYCILFHVHVAAKAFSPTEETNFSLCGCQERNVMVAYYDVQLPSDHPSDRARHWQRSDGVGFQHRPSPIRKNLSCYRELPRATDN
jgi:hypothetical protein